MNADSQGNHESAQSRKVLKEHDENSRIFTTTDGPPKILFSFHVEEFAQGDPERDTLSDQRDPQHSIIPGWVADLPRVLQVGDPFVHGHTAAK